jgi:hypothetical protein
MKDRNRRNPLILNGATEFCDHSLIGAYLRRKTLIRNTLGDSPNMPPRRGFEKWIAGFYRDSAPTALGRRPRPFTGMDGQRRQARHFYRTPPKRMIQLREERHIPGKAPTCHS